jgi:hypothetical protein
MTARGLLYTTAAAVLILAMVVAILAVVAVALRLGG